jgi:hypothetical protein
MLMESMDSFLVTARPWRRDQNVAWVLHARIVLWQESVSCMLDPEIAVLDLNPAAVAVLSENQSRLTFKGKINIT